MEGDESESESRQTDRRIFDDGLFLNTENQLDGSGAWGARRQSAAGLSSEASIDAWRQLMRLFSHSTAHKSCFERVDAGVYAQISLAVFILLFGCQ